MSVYQGLHRGMPRREVESIVKRTREVHRRRNPVTAAQLIWTEPGTVWAVDHSHMDQVGKGPEIVISSRDLASHEQLLWNLSRETAGVTTEQLREEFGTYGAPLVLKADGGSAFKSDMFESLLDEHGVELLPSPPYYPQYNGSCESANGSMKRRTLRRAQLRDSTSAWTDLDLEESRVEANTTTRPWGVRGPVPETRWQERTAVSDELREAFRTRCAQLRDALIIEEGLSAEQLARENTRRCVQRLAVSRALVEHGLLLVRRRVIRPPIKVIKTAAIS